MANLRGLESVVSQLRVERTSLLDQLRHVDAALSVLGKLNNGRSYTKPRRRRLSVAARRQDRRRPEGTLGQGEADEESRVETDSICRLYPPGKNLAGIFLRCSENFLPSDSAELQPLCPAIPD